MELSKLCLKCMRESVINNRCTFCHSPGEFNQEPVFALPLNTILHGRYLTGSVLGHGGFGMTYMAYDLKLKQRVAIKEYMPDGLSTRIPGTTEMSVHTSREDYDYGLRKFLEEARIIHAYRDNPHIISVKALFEENRTAYYVMEYLDGCDLKKYIQKKNGSLPYPEAFSLLLPIFDALDQIHTQNVIHRDISPDNIYVCADGRTKLLDFGAARVALKGKSQSLSVILKRGYAPEEQYRSHGKQGPYTDVYALAGTLYFAITGVIPPEATQRMYKDDLIPPASFCGDLSHHGNKAIVKALSVKSEDRFQSVRDFKAALTGAAPVSSGGIPALSNLSEALSASSGEKGEKGASSPFCSSPRDSWAKDSPPENSSAIWANSPKASIGRRFGALFLDGLILAVLFYGILLQVLKPDTYAEMYLCLFIASVAYSAACEASRLQATLGKRIMGLRVSGADGEPLTFGKALLRNAVKFSSTLASALISMELGGIIGLGNAVICLLNKGGSAGHDLIAKTFVAGGKERVSGAEESAFQEETSAGAQSKKSDGAVSPLVRSIGIEGISGYYENAFFPLSDKKVVLGRSSEYCQILFPEDARGVSRIHCELVPDRASHAVYIRDLGSSNGTFVAGGRKLTGEMSQALFSGDLFTIGENNTFKINVL